MSRFSALARALLPLALLAGLATGCGNKGPLFLPSPAVHEPEGAAPPAAPPPTSGDASSGEAGPQGPAEGN
jgi:predicted small lipoprotein YifL